MPYRIGFLTTHPIQYQAPVFRELAKSTDLDFRVYFCHMPDESQRGAGFGVAFDWDVPLLEGYAYEVLTNVSRQPGVVTYAGCNTPEIGNRIREARLEALVVNGWVVKSCLQGLRACEQLKIPCLVRGEANALRPRPWWKRLAHRWLLRRYAACLPIGKANAEFYRRMGVREERLFPSPYCVENRRFAEWSARSDGRVRLRKEHGIREDVACFLYCGKFIAKKHPLELIRAFGQAVDQGARAHLLMVGDGELRAECERLVRERGWPVAFTGFLNQSQIADAYVTADCLVLPSDHGETWGLVVNEAMACGRPALVSDQVGCAADLVLEGVTGSVFPFGDWPALSQRLLAMSQSQVQLATMGVAAAKHVAAYSPEAAAAGIIQAVKAVC